MTMNSRVQTHYRSCHICEATCGLRIQTEGKRVVSIEPDKDDPFSQGYICPKGVTIKEIHEDPDRIRTPLKRTTTGWEKISWQEALDTTIEKLGEIYDQYGANSIATYVGNPTGHNSGTLLFPAMLFQMIGTRNQFSAASVDTWPNHLACYLMYGHQFYTPIPDIDNTQLMVVIGGNPMVSNGSMMTAPGFQRRIKSLKKRGGRLIVIDPRRTDTAKMADEHFFVRPAQDAWLLLSMVHILFRDDLVSLNHLKDQIENIDRVQNAVCEFTPERAASYCGIDAAEIERLTHEIKNSEPAVVYGRIGVSTQEFGSISQWAIQLINLLTGNLDRKGGALFTEPAMDLFHKPYVAGSYGTYHSRVSRYPEFSGGFPLRALGEEILTPGEGQIQAFINIGGNPVCSAPDSGQVETALSRLKFMVAIDFNINESNRHADIVLPPCSPLERDNYDILFYTWSIRNITRYIPPIFEKPAETKEDSDIFQELMVRWASRQGLPAPEKTTPTDIVDEFLQSNNSYSGLSVEHLRSHPHGIDLGPLKPSLVKKLENIDKKINAAPQEFLRELPPLLERQPPDPDGLQLIGRRNIRSNNSWMNNYLRLVKGMPQNQLLMHPSDMERHQISEGDTVQVSSETGSVNVTVLPSEDMLRGVVCLPHGWGQGKYRDISQHVASKLSGVNSNYLASAKSYDRPSGNAVFNGIAVEVKRM